MWFDWVGLGLGLDEGKTRLTLLVLLVVQVLLEMWLDWEGLGLELDEGKTRLALQVLLDLQE